MNSKRILTVLIGIVVVFVAVWFAGGALWRMLLAMHGQAH